MYQAMERPPIMGQESFASSKSDYSLYSLKGMEQPIPSFKSFVRAVAPPPLATQKPLPALPTRRRASSVYSQYYPRSPSVSGRPASEAFYLQPFTFSHSETQLPHRRPSQARQFPKVEVASIALQSPDLYFGLERSPRPKSPALLQPRTYTPVPSPGPPRSKIAPSSGSRNDRPRSLIVPPLPPVKTPHTEALYQMTVDALDASPSTPKASQTFKEGFSPASHQRHRAGTSGSAFVKGQSRDKAKVALGIDDETLRSEAKRRKNLNPFTMVHAVSALRSHSIANPPTPPLPSPSDLRDSRLLSMVLDSYIEGFDFDEKPESQLYAEDYHALLSGQRRAQAESTPQAPAVPNTKASIAPLSWKAHSRKGSTASKHSVGTSTNFSRVLQVPSALRRNSTHEPASASFHHSATSESPIKPSHHFGRLRSSTVNGKRPTQSQSPAKQNDRDDTPPNSAIDARFRFTPIKDRPRDMSASPSKTKRLINTSKTMLSLRPSILSITTSKSTGEAANVPQSGIPGDTYDYTRPIPRPSIHEDQEQRIKAAIEKVKEEVAAGVEGAIEMLRPIWEEKQLPAEKIDPFGIERTRQRQLERARINDLKQKQLRKGQRTDVTRDGDERGRSRYVNLRGGVGGLGLGAGVGVGSSAQRSKSEKRREELKRRIKLVGEVDTCSVGVQGH